MKSPLPLPLLRLSDINLLPVYSKRHSIKKWTVGLVFKHCVIRCFRHKNFRLPGNNCMPSCHLKVTVLVPEYIGLFLLYIKERMKKTVR